MAPSSYAESDCDYRACPLVTLTLPEGEPEAGPWRVESLRGLLGVLGFEVDTPAGRPRIVAVDGRGGGGKSTLAQRLVDAVPKAAVVHTDDVAWHHDFFDWSSLLADGILEPLRRGAAIHYRPPGWIAKGRPGAIEVPAGLDLVVVEGVGAARRDLAPLLDGIVWMQSDFAEAERRGIGRDIAQGVNGNAEQASAWWHHWMERELPFQRDERTWERATVIVAGTPTAELAADEVQLAPPIPPRR